MPTELLWRIVQLLNTQVLRNIVIMNNSKRSLFRSAGIQEIRNRSASILAQVSMISGPSLKKLQASWEKS